MERALLQVEGVEPHYLIMVDRRGELDTLEVWVEVSESVFSDDTRLMKEFERTAESHLKTALNVRAIVRLKEPKALERSAGKARRVVDRRDIE